MLRLKGEDPGWTTDTYVNWGRRWDVRPRPRAYHARTLLTELHRQDLEPATGFEPVYPDPQSGALPIELHRPEVWSPRSDSNRQPTVYRTAARPSCCKGIEIGAASWNCTSDFRFTRATLCCLSYGGKDGWEGWSRTNSLRVQSALLCRLSYFP